jgi:crotonobetaine/carnitine-CoA ligase
MDTDSLPALIRRRAADDGAAVFVQEVDGVEQGYGAFHETVMRWADALARLGVREGDTVATMLPVSITAHHVWLGVAWNRALEVPINHDYRGSFLAHLLNDARTTILVAHADFLDQIEEIASDLVGLRTVVVTGMGPRSTSCGRWRVVASDDVLADAVARERPAPRLSDPFGIIYTSGTTGPSKGVVCPWGQLADGLDNPFPGENGRSTAPGGAYYCPWLPFHMSGKNGLEHSVGLGLRLVIRPRFSVSNFWDDVRRYRCTHTLLPFIAPWLWRAPEQPTDRDNPLERVCMVPLIPEYRRFEQRFGVRVSTCWASTEAGFPLNTADPPDDRTCGTVRPGFELRIVDSDDEEVPTGVVGELIVRNDGPWRMGTAYYANPEATAAAWRSGWFHTGDGFTRDEAGYFYFVERLKDYIKHRGHNISSAEVEAEVCRHDEVLEAVCVGRRSDLAVAGGPSDEDVRVFVVPEPGSSIDPAELHAFLTGRMPRFMLPRYIDVVDAVPRNHVNKPARAELRDRPLAADTWDALDVRGPAD